MALTCGHLKFEDLEPGPVSQWTSGPLGFAGWYEPPPPPHPVFQHLGVNGCPDNQIQPMNESHIRNIMLECSPELQVVEVIVAPGFRTEQGWKTCIRETDAGTCIEALTREDRCIAKEIGKAMIDDHDYKHYWSSVADWNMEYEKNFKLELEYLEESKDTYVLVPSCPYEDADLSDCSPRPGDLLEFRKEPILDEVKAAMVEVDKKKDEADEDMMKEMARFESETRLHLLRTTPPEDRYVPLSEQVDCQYQGWIRDMGNPHHVVYTDATFVPLNRQYYESVYLKERIRCTAEIIRKPSNSRGYALAVCDYGLLHIATKHLCRVPEIGETILATIAPVDIQRERPFPLTTIYIH
jgi:hypothetical protein